MNNNLENAHAPVLQVPVWMLKTVEPFCNLFPINPVILSRIVESMTANGYDFSQPIIAWNMAVIDGHTRLRAAIAAGLEKVPVVCKKFSDEDKALEYAINRQKNRRNLTDAELLQCLKALDYRKKTGRPTKDSISPSDHGKSCESVAKILGISSKKVERLRAINDYASDEIKEAFRQGKYTVSGAYEATMAPRRKKPEFLPDADAEMIHSVMADIHSRLNEVQIRKLIKALQLEIANN